MPRTTNRVLPFTLSRRNFLRLCGVASGALGPGVASLPAFAQTTPKKGGTLRVGFYIEAATMDPHLSGSKVDRQIYHNIYEPLVTLDVKLGIKPGLAESWQQPDPKTAGLQAPPRREVPRRDRLQRRGRQVQLQPHEDRAEVGAQGRGGQHRAPSTWSTLHDQAQPEATRTRRCSPP